MLAAIAHASTISNFEDLLLAVATSNVAARSLYLSLGFKPHGVERAALSLVLGLWTKS